MRGHLYKSNDDNQYYLIDNVGAYNCIVIEFATFQSSFISIESIERNFNKIEFNFENIKNLLNSYTIFEKLINYDYYEKDNFIIYNSMVYHLRDWIDIYNFASKNI